MEIDIFTYGRETLALFVSGHVGQCIGTAGAVRGGGLEEVSAARRRVTPRAD